jgi:catechol 2,3-dioxygenase-like lactoylglutathione lyase family enzyme
MVALSPRGIIHPEGVEMNQHLHIVTLGVRDLETSKKFYSETVGWKIARPQEGVAFFQAGGVVLALFPLDELAADAAVSAEGSGFDGFSLAYNAHSEAEVDEIIADLKSKGVKIVKEPQKVFWGGYSSYFADPDDHLWEVAYNPFFPFDENGNLKLD